MHSILEDIKYYIKLKWMMHQVKKVKIQISDRGLRLKRYLEGIQKGEVDYVIQGFEEIIEKKMEVDQCTREESIESILNTLRMVEGMSG